MGGGSDKLIDPPGVPLLPRQWDFIRDDTHAELMYSGAFGAGKTRALCLRALRKAANPKAVVGLGRKTMVDLRRTTLATLLEPIGDLPPILPHGSYKHPKSPVEKIILRGGGEIVPFGFDNEAALGSTQFSDCCIDEAVEIEESQWNQLGGRLRVVWNGRTDTPCLCSATNPSSPTHFLFKRFYENPEPGFSRTIDTCTFDNYFLPESYLHRLGRMRGVARLRYLFGRWVAAEGMVYPMYDPSIHERHEVGPFKGYVAGVDFGYTNPMVLRVHGVYRDGASHVVASFHQAETTQEEFLGWCALAKEQYPGILFVVDPSAASLIASMKRKNLRTKAANNDVIPGIGLIRDRLMPSEFDGLPRLTFEPNLEGQYEYLAYELDAKKQGECPKKENDHVPDADRYAVCEIERQYGGSRHVIHGGPIDYNKGRQVIIAGQPKGDEWLDSDRLWQGGGVL